MNVELSRKNFIFLSVALLILICRMRIEKPNTTCFFSEKFDLLNIEGIDVKTRVGAKALVDAEICMIPVEQAKALSERYPSLIWSYIRELRKMMMYLCVVNNQRMCLPAEDCYRWFLPKSGQRLINLWPLLGRNQR